MNTNIKVVLNDQERSHIKNLIDGKASSKMATRGDINEKYQKKLSITGTDINFIIKVKRLAMINGLISLVMIAVAWSLLLKLSH